MNDFIYYEEGWNIWEGEVPQGGTSSTNSSENAAKRSWR